MEESRGVRSLRRRPHPVVVPPISPSTDESASEEHASERGQAGVARGERGDVVVVR